MIWKELIEELQPDIMLVSVPRALYKLIFTSKENELIAFNEKKNKTLRKKPYVVKVSEYVLKNNKKVKVIFGQAANKPFDTINNQQKKIIGELCRN